jgi:predicted outer membrane repeat protein
VSVNSTDPKINFDNTRFNNCTAVTYGGAIYLEHYPINMSFCTFSGNVASGGFGNDVYLAASVSYPTSYIKGCCSDSEDPKLTNGTTDLSDMLSPCLTTGYLSSSTNTPVGTDSNGFI